MSIFCTVEIENDNTRIPYLRAIRQFDAWCLAKGIGYYQLQPYVIAAYTKELKETHHPQTVKQPTARAPQVRDEIIKQLTARDYKVSNEHILHLNRSASA